MRTKSSWLVLIVFGLAVLAWASLKHRGNASPVSAHGPTFRASAEVVSTAPRLRVKLSMTNISDQDQTFWAATKDCTNERWKSDNPNIRVLDYCVAHMKTEMSACQHHVILHPGETFSEVVTPFLGQSMRLGKQTFRFANFQPDLNWIDGSPLPPGRKYQPRVFWTEPVTVPIHKEWLGQNYPMY